MRLSKSKINCYLKCPREFKYRYIDEIEVPPNEYMALGSDVHLIAEKFSEKFEDDLDDVDIENELLKITHEENIGYDLTDHIDNLGSFFKRAFVDNDYKLFCQEEYLLDEENRFSGICDSGSYSFYRICRTISTFTVGNAICIFLTVASSGTGNK